MNKKQISLCILICLALGSCQIVYLIFPIDNHITSLCLSYNHTFIVLNYAYFNYIVLYCLSVLLLPNLDDTNDPKGLMRR